MVLQKTVFEAKESSHHNPKVLEKLPSQEVISPHKKGIPALASHAQIPSAGSQIQAHPVCNCEISGKMQRILRQEVSVLLLLYHCYMFLIKISAKGEVGYSLHSAQGERDDQKEAR